MPADFEINWTSCRKYCLLALTKYVKEEVKNETAKDKKIAVDNEMADDVCLTIHDFLMMV